MSEIVKMIGEMVVDKFPVVLIIGIFLTLVFSGPNRRGTVCGRMRPEDP